MDPPSGKLYLSVPQMGIIISFEDFLNLLHEVRYQEDREKLCTQIGKMFSDWIDGQGCETEETSMLPSQDRKFLFAEIDQRGCETLEEAFTKHLALYRRTCENLCDQFRKMIFAENIDGRPVKEINMEYDGTSSALEGPKSEELNRDILPSVLQKVGIVSLLSSAPYVCKAWHEATLDPKCWENLDFADLFKLTVERPDRVPSTACIKSIVDRSCRRATSITLPNYFTLEALEYVGNECPALKSLTLHHPMSYQQSVVISNQISNWGNLETVTLMGGFHGTKILLQISLHCKNFTELKAPQSHIGKDEASLIVTGLPKIKHLFLKGSTIGRENLVTIIQGCKELVSLDVSGCTGFKVADAEILRLASKIPIFKCEGSRDFVNNIHRLFNGVPRPELEQARHIDVDWGHFFHNF